MSTSPDDLAGHGLSDDVGPPASRSASAAASGSATWSVPGPSTASLSPSPARSRADATPLRSGPPRSPSASTAWMPASSDALAGDGLSDDVEGPDTLEVAE